MHFQTFLVLVVCLTALAWAEMSDESRGKRGALVAAPLTYPSPVGYAPGYAAPYYSAAPYYAAGSPYSAPLVAAPYRTYASGFSSPLVAAPYRTYAPGFSAPGFSAPYYSAAPYTLLG